MRIITTLLSFFIATILLTNCGSEDDDKETSTGASTSYTFATNINPIIVRSCVSAGSCHGSGAAGRPIYQDRSDLFITGASSILNRIARTDSLKMPPPTSSQTLSDEDNKIIVDYLAQSVRN